MLLAPSTLEAIHRASGEEPMPQNHLLRRAVALVYAVDRSIWARRVDLCLIGGDPLVLAARLRQETLVSSAGAPRRIAVLHAGRFSGAPLAALEDDDVLAEFLDLGALPAQFVDRSLQGSARVRDILHRMSADLGQRIAASGIAGYCACEHVQAVRDQARGETVLRLTRMQGVDRRSGRLASDHDLSDALRPAGDGDAAALFSRSRDHAAAGIAAILRQGLPGFESPPRGARFADVIIARRVEVLGGFISPGEAAGERPGVDFMQEGLEARLFHFARRVPLSVADALTMWRTDLLEAIARSDLTHHINRRQI